MCGDIAISFLIEFIVTVMATPYNNKIAPYKEEIEMFKTQTFNPNLK